jgi:hypothetical protein
VELLVEELHDLPRAARPGGEAVAVMTLHPQFLSKSAYPARLLRDLGLEKVGSRPTTVTPEKWTRKGEPQPSRTVDLFVAGSLEQFENLGQVIPRASLLAREVTSIEEIYKIEDLRAPIADERLRIDPSVAPDEPAMYEVVLHAQASRTGDQMVSAFLEYARASEIQANEERRLYAGGLCFVPLLMTRDQAQGIADFSFIRSIRPLPPLRQLNPNPEAVEGFDVQLPSAEPISPDIKVAILDGGFDSNSPLSKWVRSFEAPGLKEATEEFIDHGTTVASAFLFGNLRPEASLIAPYSNVDVWRVIDADAYSDPFHLFDGLRAVQDVLRSRQYEYINISFGPRREVDPADIDPWTAVLDEYAADGSVLISIATGNWLEQERDTGQQGLQIPADAVNALSVGAADSSAEDWDVASYSAIGPARSPGWVKPDVVAFGGEQSTEPFYVLDPIEPESSIGTEGTSYASPLALRLAVGLRAHFGSDISPMVARALLVHTASDDTSSIEAGWGRIADDIASIATCPDHAVRVIYEGRLTPAKFLRAEVPLPDGGLPSHVHLTATVVCATGVDSADPSSYTRAGAHAIFRPNALDKSTAQSTYAKSHSLFHRSDYGGAEVREDAPTWEPVVHGVAKIASKKLYQPVIDLHYNARDAGGLSQSSPDVRYAMVLTIAAPGATDFYDRVRARYRNILTTIQPRVQIQVNP